MSRSRKRKAGVSWFEGLFEIPELPNHAASDDADGSTAAHGYIQRQITMDGTTMKCKGTTATYNAGTFSTPSVQEVRHACLARSGRGQITLPRRAAPRTLLATNCVGACWGVWWQSVRRCTCVGVCCWGGWWQRVRCCTGFVELQLCAPTHRAVSPLASRPLADAWCTMLVMPDARYLLACYSCAKPASP